MSTFSKTAREVEMPNGDIVVLHNAVTENTTSNIKKFKYDDNGHVTESTAANATDLNLNSYSTPTTGSTAIGTSDAVQTAIGKLDHQSQIDQSNILYGLEKIGTNLIKPRDDLPTVVTALPEGLRVQRSNTTSSFAYVKCGTVYLESGKKYALYDATYAPTTKHHYFYVDCGGNGFIELSTPSLTATVQYGTGRTTGTYDIYTRIDANSTVDSISTPIICLESVWKQLDSYTPYGAPNYDLTRLEAEDRAGLIDVIDGGAKNFAKIPTTQTIGSITFTKDSNEWITSNSSTPDGRQWSDANKNVVYSVKAGRYIIYGETASTNTGAVDAYVIVNGNLYQPLIITANSNGTVEVNLTSAGTIGLMYKPYSSNKVRYMVATKAAFGVSQKFVPYYNPASPVLGGGYEIPQNSSMDRLTSIGKWRCYDSVISSTVTNAPFRTGFFGWTMNSITDSTRYIQIAIENTNVFNIAKRRWDGTSWSAWAYISSDAVTHYKADTTTTIGTDWTLTSIVLQAPVDALVPMTVMALWGAKAPRGIRITRTNTSATNNVIATIEVSEDKGQIQASGFGAKLNGVNTYYVWAKAKESGTMPVYLTYSYPIKD